MITNWKHQQDIDLTSSVPHPEISLVAKEFSLYNWPETQVFDHLFLHTFWSPIRDWTWLTSRYFLIFSLHIENSNVWFNRHALTVSPLLYTISPFTRKNINGWNKKILISWEIIRQPDLKWFLTKWMNSYHFSIHFTTRLLIRIYIYIYVTVNEETYLLWCSSECCLGNDEVSNRWQLSCSNRGRCSNKCGKSLGKQYRIVSDCKFNRLLRIGTKAWSTGGINVLFCL